MMGIAVAVTTLAGCAGDGAQQATILVPADAATIQEAVDRARPGDLVSIMPGTYHESVTVDRPGIVIRGLDRNEVILDGGNVLANGFAVSADNVAIENLSVRNFRQNGVLFSGALAADPYSDSTPGEGDEALDGYRVSYVTASDNGLYGVYAFAARNGLIEKSYSSGHPDSGFYVGQCRPCNVVITDVIAENNAIGYYGTNASGDVWIVNSVFRGNRLGLTPNSQDTERLAPQEGATVAGNLVVDNDNPSAPEIGGGFFGGGIAVGGGARNVIIRNRVSGHDWAGIVVMPLGEFEPADNEIRDNVLSDNAIDLGFIGGPGSGNCFVDNDFSTSAPDQIEVLMPCEQAERLSDESDIPLLSAPRVEPERRAPPQQATMPGAAAAPAVAPEGPPPYPILNLISTPTG